MGYMMANIKQGMKNSTLGVSEIVAKFRNGSLLLVGSYALP